ncbi:hypothetical protein FACS1894158_09530 [Betaproteobacteria bacterium]|nr:hypothetical protein FACS1894158_09530 [Betaproteobacteria bacterium]
MFVNLDRNKKKAIIYFALGLFYLFLYSELIEVPLMRVLASFSQMGRGFIVFVITSPANAFFLCTAYFYFKSIQSKINKTNGPKRYPQKGR